jgi:hypothetical protein
VYYGRRFLLTAVHQIAQPTVRELPVRHFHGESRLDPSDAACEPKVMEWRARHLSPAPQQILRRSQAETPLDRPAKQQAPAATLTEQQAGEPGRQAEDAANNDPARAADSH